LQCSCKVCFTSTIIKTLGCILNRIANVNQPDEKY
jgi:hypothetical protein